MAIKKAASKKRSTSKKTRKAPGVAARAKTIRKKGAATVAKAGSAMKKRVAKVAKKASAAAANPKRTVRRAAANVHKTATRARDIGETVVTAGELIQQTADFVDTVAQRSATRSKARRKR